VLERERKNELTIRQLKDIPLETIFGRYESIWKELKPFVEEYKKALAEYRDRRNQDRNFRVEEDEGLVRELFQPCRNIYERGTNILRDLENSSLDECPTWNPSNGKDLGPGDYVHGILLRENKEGGYSIKGYEGNVTEINRVDQGLSISLSNANNLRLNGSGNRDIEGLLLPDKGWAPRIWKFNPGKGKLLIK
jgi:hypothetical protein